MKDLVSFRGFFLKITFLHGEIFEIPPFSFRLKILFNVNGKGHSVTHPLLYIVACRHQYNLQQSVLGMRSCRVKLDEEYPTCAGLAQENSFGFYTYKYIQEFCRI